MQRQTKSFTKIAVLILLALAFLLRVYKIGSNPPSLDWDEVSHGYNAYSILRTGKDEWGKTFPLIFRAYGDYKLPVYIYLTAISEYIFGLSNFSVRIVSILAGTLSVLFTYLLVQELFWKDKYKNKYALLSAVLMTIEPWSFFLSRAAFEANLALFFSISGFYFFLKGMRKNDWKILLGSVFLGLTVWTYNSYRIFTPLLVIVAILIYRYEFVASMKKNKFLVFSYALILLIFFIPMLAQLLGTTGQARYSWVAILDAGGIGKIIELRNSSGFNPTITRLLYNRPTYFLYNFVKNYFSHFSPNFLFLKGGSNFQFSVPDMGLLYLIDIPFLLFGFVSTLKHFNKTSKLILFWVILAPVASSLTREAPHVLRFITILPIPMVLTSVGLSRTNFKFISRKVFYFSYFVVLAILAGSYLNNYFREYRVKYSYVWQYGYKEVVDYAKNNYNKYDKIIVTKKYGEPHEFFLFYWPWEPTKYQSDKNLNRFYQSNWYWVDSFDKFYFVNDWQVVNSKNDKIFTLESKVDVDCQKSKCLLITSPGNVPSNWKYLKAVNFLDGKEAFEIYEN